MRVHMSGSGHGQGGTVRHETGRGQGDGEGTGREGGDRKGGWILGEHITYLFGQVACAVRGVQDLVVEHCID